MTARADSADDLGHSGGEDSGSEQRAEEDAEEEFQVSCTAWHSGSQDVYEASQLLTVHLR